MKKSPVKPAANIAPVPKKTAPKKAAKKPAKKPAKPIAIDDEDKKDEMIAALKKKFSIPSNSQVEQLKNLVFSGQQINANEVTKILNVDENDNKELIGEILAPYCEIVVNE